MILDTSGRSFRKLRISLTSRCNYACLYCSPGQRDHQPGSHLSVDEILRRVSSIHRVSPLRSIRLTGGEPLLYRDLLELIPELKVMGIPGVHITTNGSMLFRLCESLKEAGLDSINLSLDSVVKKNFHTLSGGGEITSVVAGLDRAREMGIPLKINSTIIRGVNDGEVLPLLDFARSRGLTIRFIELMGMGPFHNHLEEKLYPAAEILDRIRKKYRFVRLEQTPGSTAILYRIEEGGEFGIIANESEPFCSHCDRLRMDSRGVIYGCLSSADGFPVDGKDDVATRFLLRRALATKQSHRFSGTEISMKDIGG